MKKRLISIIIVMAFMINGCSAVERKEKTEEKSDNRARVAETTPYGKYPELITYTLGKMTGVNNSNMPYGDTYENNAYTRYMREKLNIQNENVFEIEETGNYQGVISMAIASQNIPDVMVVTDYDTVQMLVENDMIEDLTQGYEDCASERIKSIYNSYGEEILENVTFDGKLMALPETNIENGPSLLWIRKDWMDILGLKAPKDMDDVCHIIKQFVKKDPGKNGKGNTVGLVCSDELTGECGYSYEFQTDIVFADYGAFPKQWIYDKEGNVVYGSVQPEAKEALKKLASMYKQGLIDENFLLRGKNNIIDLIEDGYCGAFFGQWWAPNNPLMKAREKNPEAEWVPYLIETDDDGSTSYVSQNPTGNYIVVRKGYEHPEIVFKIVSILFDNFKYGKEDISKYYQMNVDATARPLAVNVDYKDALLNCYHAIRDTLDGKRQIMDLELLEGAYYKSCRRYEREKSNTIEDWAAYTSRITACKIIDESKTVKVESLYFGKTKSMKDYWWKLKELEKNTYLAIVTGDKPVSYFDEFVNKWYMHGGGLITAEVSEAVTKKDKPKRK